MSIPGSLTVGGSFTAKPYVAVRLVTDFSQGTYPRTPLINYFGVLTSGKFVSILISGRSTFGPFRLKSGI